MLNKSIHINLGETGIVASPARLPSQLITESRADFEHIASILLSFGFLLQERERTKDVCARLAPSRQSLAAPAEEREVHSQGGSLSTSRAAPRSG